MSTRSAEMVKYASNNFLLVKVSFANELAQIATALGAEPKTVLQAVGLDPRIAPRFLEHGLGWGGGCFPKDIRGLQAAARRVDVPTDMLDAALKVNYGQVPYYVAELKKRLGRPLADQRIAVLGLSFKPGTDDTRASPSLRLIHALLGEGAQVTAYDPQVKQRLAADFKEVEFTDSLEAALQGTQAAIIATAWPDIKAWAQKPAGYQGVVLDARP
jgi:UDPglucose 6-dehydrogenase